MGRTYTCNCCGKTYDAVENEEWSTEKAQAEYHARFPGDPEMSEARVVCDDCYQAMTKAIPPEDLVPPTAEEQIFIDKMVKMVMDVLLYGHGEVLIEQLKGDDLNETAENPQAPTVRQTRPDGEHTDRHHPATDHAGQ